MTKMEDIRRGSLADAERMTTALADAWKLVVAKQRKTSKSRTP